MNTKWLIPYDHAKKNIEFWDMILVWNWLDFDNYGKVYRMKYVDMIWKWENQHMVFGIYCKNIKWIIYPSLYLDHDMSVLLFIDRRPRYIRFISLFRK